MGIEAFPSKEPLVHTGGSSKQPVGWSSSLVCGCFDAPLLHCVAGCCPVVLPWLHRNRREQFEKVLSTPTLPFERLVVAFLVVWLVCLIATWFGGAAAVVGLLCFAMLIAAQCAARLAMRQHFGIDGHWAWDCLASALCHCCSAVQLSRQATALDDDSLTAAARKQSSFPVQDALLGGEPGTLRLMCDCCVCETALCAGCPRPREVSRRSSYRRCAYGIVAVLGLVVFIGWAALAVQQSENAKHLLQITAAVNQSTNSTAAVGSGPPPLSSLGLPQSTLAQFDLEGARAEVVGTVFFRMRFPLLQVEVREQFFSGANFRLNGDGGAFHSWVASLPASYERVSSHTSGAPQYGFPMGGYLQTLLTGTVPATGDTWFQLEAASSRVFGCPVCVIMHMLDYFEYKAIHRNIGPLGMSVHIDSNPIQGTYPGAKGRL